jgi:hypothetical protein
MIINRRFFRLFNNIAFVFTILHISQAQDVTLPISLENQSGNNVCWAASGYMVLNYFNIKTNNYTTEQADIITRGTGGSDIGLPLSSLKPILTYYASGTYPNFCDWWDSPKSLSSSDNSSISGRIDNEEPIIAEVNTGDINADHAVVITGYNIQDNMVWYNDPGYQLVNGQKYYITEPQTIDYSEFYSVWTKSIPINNTTSILDQIAVTSGPTILTYQTSNPTYQCSFKSVDGNSSVSSFNWTLSLYYSGGTTIVAIGSSTIKSNLGCDNKYFFCSTWTPFSLPLTLPPGFNWTRDANGLIDGYITVQSTDSDKILHVSSPYFITYSEKNPYPSNIPFESQVVSSSHTDINAHNEIQLINDQITNAGSVNFKAGQEIVIGPETKILSGSNVNLTIVPSLQ